MQFSILNKLHFTFFHNIIRDHCGHYHKYLSHPYSTNNIVHGNNVLPKTKFTLSLDGEQPVKCRS